MKTISLSQCVGMIFDGASLMIGGFMAVGTPERRHQSLVATELKVEAAKEDNLVFYQS